MEDVAFQNVGNDTSRIHTCFFNAAKECDLQRRSKEISQQLTKITIIIIFYLNNNNNLFFNNNNNNNINNNNNFNNINNYNFQNYNANERMK